VTVFDDLSAGKLGALERHLEQGDVRFVRGDARSASDVTTAMAGHDVAFHFVAAGHVDSHEAPRGLDDTRKNLELGTIATHNVLDAARRHKLQRVVLASSAAVYGEASRPSTEDELALLPSSVFGATKLASEALASAYARSFELPSLVFRFGAVVGARGHRGPVRTFLEELRAHPEHLDVPDESLRPQQYLHVEDCVDAIVFAFSRMNKTFDVFNVAPDGATKVRVVAEACVAASPYPNAKLRFGGPGSRHVDLPAPRMNADKLARLGFRPRSTSDEALERSVRELALEVFPP
jgi:UDP-glucose 4-epimerase